MNTSLLAAQIEPLHDFWAHWGFEPWSHPPFAGVFRLQRFVKGGLLGRVAEYQAWDAIVWTSGTVQDRDQLWQACRPMPNVLTQRFLFLLDEPWAERRIRSFAWGFMGYLEFYAYSPGMQANEKARDLTGLIDLAVNFVKNTA